jgi:glycosyltransferase involved in cell wall biosynthesis
MVPPQISVLVITYNQVQFVRETVESVVQQDCDSFEVVVADDGSTDGTAEAILQLQREYPDKVVPAVGGPNLGIPGNFNRGLALCRGELIALQGGDDLFLPGKLRAQRDWFAADARRVLCGHDAYIFDSDSGVNTRRYSDLREWEKGGSGPFDFLARGCPYLPTTVMLRRSAMPARGFDPRISTVTDGKLFIETLLGGGHYGQVPGVLARYRRHANNITTSGAARVLADSFTMLALLEAEHPELTGACRKGRARLHVRSGIQALQAGNQAAARLHLGNAFTTAPDLSWKVPAWYALSWLPPGVNRELLGWAKRRRVGIT